MALHIYLQNTSIGQNLTNFRDFGNTQILSLSDVLYKYLARTTDTSALLFSEACGPNHDCTTTCKDVNQAFESSKTLQNCMIYPLIAHHVQANTIDSDSLYLANYFGINDDSASTQIHNTVSNCLDSYITSQGGHTGVGQCIRNPSTNQSNAYCYDDPCRQLDAPFNSDIGGVGVYISYFMQVGLALAVFLAFKICTSWTFWPAYGALLLKSKSRISHRARDQAHHLQAKLQKSVDVIVTTAVEFQKNQCFFVLAIQMAALISLHTKGRLLDGSSLEQLAVNYFLVGWVSVAGFLPITFTLACLHIMDQRSWYTVLLSGITIVVSTSTFFVAKSTVPDPNSVGVLPNPVVNCGTSNPVKYCYGNTLLTGKIATWNTSRGLGGLSILLHSYLMYALLVIDICLHRFTVLAPRVRIFRPEATNLEDTPESEEQYQNLELSPAPKQWKPLLILGLLLYTCALAGYIYFFYQYFNVLGQFRSSVTDQWTFGQIVAVTIWAPVVFEFGHLQIRGVPKVFAHRLSEKYRVIKIGVQDPSERHKSEEAEGKPRQTSRISNFLQHPLMSVFGFDVDGPGKGGKAFEYELRRSRSSEEQSILPRAREAEAQLQS